jgi:hypothetical protein
MEELCGRYVAQKKVRLVLPNCVLPIIFNQPTGVKDIIGHLFQIKEFQTQFEAWNRLLEIARSLVCQVFYKGVPPDTVVEVSMGILPCQDRFKAMFAIFDGSLQKI